MRIRPERAVRTCAAADARSDAPQPAERPEPVAVLLCELDGPSPVGLDAEVRGAQPPTPAAGDEHDGHVRSFTGTRIELGNGLAGSHSADVHAGDADSRGDS